MAAALARNQRVAVQRGQIRPTGIVPGHAASTQVHAQKQSSLPRKQQCATATKSQRLQQASGQTSSVRVVKRTVATTVATTGGAAGMSAGRRQGKDGAEAAGDEDDVRRSKYHDENILLAIGMSS